MVLVNYQNTGRSFKKDGYPVKGVKNYQNLLYHYGGMSGFDFKGAKGMDVEMDKVISWFDKNSIEVIDHIENLNTMDTSNSKANRIYRKKQEEK